MAIIRISGAKATAIVDGLFQASSGQRLREARTYMAMPGRLEIPGSGKATGIQVTEEVGGQRSAVRERQELSIRATVYLMRAPYSYTREDVVEVHTVGSPPVLELVLAALLKGGARLAGPGEFTRRAFLSGRIDLARAESVMAMVRSRSESELRAAARQLRGAMGDMIRTARDELFEVCALVEAAIDFSDQDIQVISTQKMAAQLRDLARRIKGMGRRPHGRSESEAVIVAIAGEPNVGKSSLLNALVERYAEKAVRQRAIVSHVPGTTRDTIEARICIRGVAFRLVDTAGLRESDDEVDTQAVQRAKSAQEGAEIVLWVIDGTLPVPEGANPVGRRVIPVVNKKDLAQAKGLDSQLARVCPGLSPIRTSAVTGEGVDVLAQRMAEAVLGGDVDRSGAAVVANARQQEALGRAGEAILGAATHLEENTGLELSALEMRAALDALGEITGVVTTEDFLDKIFGQFCIGK